MKFHAYCDPSTIFSALAWVAYQIQKAGKKQWPDFKSGH